jgi:hypothetical protein
MMVITSSTRPTLSTESYGVLADIEGLSLNRRIPSVDLEKPGFTVGIKKEVVSVQFKTILTMGD